MKHGAFGILIVFALVISMMSSVCCISHNELKFLRLMSGKQNPESAVLRQVDHDKCDDADCLARLARERDELKELLVELADFAEENT
ncbi:hypothetical protein KKA53_00660 [Candidatus Dependentiae bacterium]|nr:hypothetical protein [Candidatus Dependentiae bacterium]